MENQGASLLNLGVLGKETHYLLTYSSYVPKASRHC